MSSLSTPYVLQTLLTQKQPGKNFLKFLPEMENYKKMQNMKKKLLQKIDLLGFAK